MSEKKEPEVIIEKEEWRILGYCRKCHKDVVIVGKQPERTYPSGYCFCERPDC